MASPPTSSRTLRLSLALLLAASLSGCGWLAHGYERAYGKPVPSEYNGLAGKSAVIVVFVPTDLLNEYTQAPLEISEFFKAELVASVPSVRLVDTREIIRWQNSTDWTRLSDADIAAHFKVDRIIHIELIEYRTKEPGIEGYIRGRINTNVRITENGPGDSGNIGWKKMSVGVEWPEFGPVDMTRVTEADARYHTLQAYGKILAAAFSDHHDITRPMSDTRIR